MSTLRRAIAPFSLRRLAPFAATALLAACGGAGPASTPAASSSPVPATSAGAAGAVAGGGTHVAVEITDAGCRPTPAEAPAGPITFDLTNHASELVLEFEVRQGIRVAGEKEGLEPNGTSSLFLNLEAGDYRLHCPDAPTDGAFTVTAAAVRASGSAGPLAALNQAAVDNYATYVREQAAHLVTATEAFANAVRAGDVAQARSLYGPARVFYERIEPVAESFGDLDPAIDARIADVDDPAAWTGFHRIEQSLWVSNTTAGMAPVADRLVADVHRLQALVATETYDPAQLANGASELLDEVAKSKITGEEEAYSRIDLVDFAANIDGAKAAFTFLEPSLRHVDGPLADTIVARFAAVEAGLTPLRKGDGYVSYEDVPADTIRSLASLVDALAEPLSTVAAKVCAC